jgi:septal ring factor EnvC (AmiA/AmiB activator)
MAKIEIYVCDNCGTKLGELACGNSKGGSYCSVECAEQAELSTVADSQFLDLIANLARRVASLEQQLSATQGNVEKLAEELANTKHHTYSIERDVMEVEKQTEVLHAIRLFYERGRR